MNIMHDGGGAFKRDGEFVLGEVANRVEVLNSLSHGLTSVCDNNGNAILKNQWRAERGDLEEAKSTIYLLWCMDYLQPNVVEAMWTRNFFLDQAELKVEHVEARLKEVAGKKAKNQALADQYEDAYENWLEENEEKVPKQGLVMKEASLDGSYWAE